MGAVRQHKRAETVTIPSRSGVSRFVASSSRLLDPGEHRGPESILFFPLSLLQAVFFYLEVLMLERQREGRHPTSALKKKEEKKRKWAGP